MQGDGGQEPWEVLWVPTAQRDVSRQKDDKTQVWCLESRRYKCLLLSALTSVGDSSSSCLLTMVLNSNTASAQETTVPPLEVMRSVVLPH